MQLTGSSHKADIADCLIVMGKMSAVRDEAEEEYEVAYCTGISYITDEVKSALKCLLTFKNVTD